jgi:hypothetical protein
MSKILPFTRLARRTPEGQGLVAPLSLKGGATITILPVVRIERHKVLDCNEKTPPEGPSRRPPRKRA